MNSLALILKIINLFLPCKLIFRKATKVGSPPNFPKLISQLWEIPQPQYFITLSLDPHWTYFWKHYIYSKKDTKVGSQNFGYQIWFCTRLIFETETRWSPFHIWHVQKHFLQYVRKGPIDNNPTLVHTMTWRIVSAKPPSEPVAVRLLTYMRHSASMS